MMEKENSSLVDQLKNDGNDGIPTITPSGVQDENVASIQPTPVSMTADDQDRRRPVAVENRRKGVTRVPLDLNGLPSPQTEEDKISLSHEIQSKVFAPGGDFDQMIERKKAEMEADIQRQGFAEEVAAGARKIASTGAVLPTGAEEIADNLTPDADGTPSEAYEPDDFDDDDFDDEEDLPDETYDVSGAATVNIDDDDFADENADDAEPQELVEAEEETPKYTYQPAAGDTSEEPVKKEHDVIQFPDTDGIKEAGTISETVDVAVELDDNASDDIDDEERDLRTQYLKEEISKKLRPVSKKLDVSGFAVLKRGTKDATALSKAFNREVPLAKWPLVNTGIVVTTKAISGSMLELLRTHISNNNTKDALRIMYDHIVSSKPMNFNAWAKSIDADDFDHLFFAYYISAFQGSNFIPIDCPNKDCPRKVFITDDMPFIKMVDFHSKENKAKFNKIYNEEPTPDIFGTTASYRIALSDKIAVDISRPSLYSEYIEMSYINDRYIKTNADVISYMRYIDEMYTIDAENGQLIPIDYKEDKNSEGKTVASKVRAYAKAIRTLTSDELAVLDAHISKLAEDVTEITYQRPATKCTICGEEIPAEPMSAAALVFIRNRLALLTII